jgi:hypothetical protein
MSKGGNKMPKNPDVSFAKKVAKKLLRQGKVLTSPSSVREPVLSPLSKVQLQLDPQRHLVPRSSPPARRMTLDEHHKRERERMTLDEHHKKER